MLREATWEVTAAVDWTPYSAASALMQVGGRAAEPMRGAYFYSQPEAMGVAGIISPWNSPVIPTLRSLAPALAAGCTTMLKMPGQTGLTNSLFAQVVAATESLPAGLVNVLSEAGNEVAPPLVTSPHVAVISYTGSTHVGRAIAAAGAPTLKRMTWNSAGRHRRRLRRRRTDAVLPVLVAACTLMNGQFCVTGSRVLAQPRDRRRAAHPAVGRPGVGKGRVGRGPVEPDGPADRQGQRGADRPDGRRRCDVRQGPRPQ